MYFWSWGYLKPQVYTPLNPSSLTQQKDVICHKTTSSHPDMRDTNCECCDFQDSECNSCDSRQSGTVKRCAMEHL
ncbi:hypothetical protein CEXT_65341 [Caerostris extrusa]|uniref:Uncharacterized protein n=1 Tax=Caerostris extrusa TaxID=172846 RepID=A0AAV4V3M7_CAEEX|nr:hypothetical protein CEXT_65341 [Caerostris extrusa]